MTRANPACLTHAQKHREPENKANAREHSSGAATVGRRSAAVAPHGRRGQEVGPDVSMSTRSARTDAEEDGVDGRRQPNASRSHASRACTRRSCEEQVESVVRVDLSQRDGETSAVRAAMASRRHRAAERLTTQEDAGAHEQLSSARTSGSVCSIGGSSLMRRPRRRRFNVQLICEFEQQARTS